MAMDEQQLLLEEYKMLREEINQKIGYQNTLLTFTDTVVVSIISLITGIKGKFPTEMYLMPLVIIVPMMFRVAYYRDAVARIAAYITVFIEPKLLPIQWETRQFSIEKNLEEFDVDERTGKNKKVKKPVFKGKQNCYDFIILAIVCYGIFFVQKKQNLFNGFNILEYFACFLFLLVEIAIIVFSLKILNISKSRDLWNEYWKKIENKEAHRQEISK